MSIELLISKIERLEKAKYWTSTIIINQVDLIIGDFLNDDHSKLSVTELAEKRKLIDTLFNKCLNIDKEITETLLELRNALNDHKKDKDSSS